MRHILIRCDASLSIGSGHVIRCRTLARELRRRGSEIIFLCRRQQGDLIELLEQEFMVLSLPEQPLRHSNDLQGRDLYKAWLGCDQRRDAADCLESLTKSGISKVDWLVVDHYGLDINWENQLVTGMRACNSQPRLLVIDDLADRVHQADLLLDQNFFGNETDQRYEQLVPASCKTLTGPHYALLGPEYAQLHAHVPQRNELKRVMVYFGGVDPDDLTGRTLEALFDPRLKDIAVDVVLGHQSSHRKTVMELVTRRPLTTLHKPLSSLAGLIARADLAIGAGGTTTWERCCLGLPTIVVSIAENQNQLVKALEQTGHVQILGKGSSVTTRQIRTALLAELAKPREAISKITDGWGASRLAIAMLGAQGKIELSPATDSDEALLLRWANESEVRANSFSPHTISETDHHRWFKEGIDNSNRLLFIAREISGCPIGQVRFDLQQDEANGDIREAQVDLSLDRCARGHGYASSIVRLGLQAMEKCWGSKTEAVAEVLESNTASNNCFAKAGFKPEKMNTSNNERFLQPIKRWRWCRDTSACP